MGIKERKERSKAKVRADILKAALFIIKTEGTQALSMRKIADSIEYAVPVIYEHFENKEAILVELCRQGYAELIKQIIKKDKDKTAPREKLEVITYALWNFATKEQELYQLMYSIGIGCNNVEKTFPELCTFNQLVKDGLSTLPPKGKLAGDMLQCKYLSFISMVHGLVSANYFLKDIDPATNRKVLKEFIDNMVRSQKVPH
ncbi:TetR/AcrR family transcriptional regulator [Paraflavitalea soli]|uniref:TetR/AcrR family transcriptional regulator n=1 Tax=Paraflavitalea soli TaxID=2315862 RepID=A0A3B7MJM5_9BACT|nr:TetR/AcrR family transcriptional regulator [Paraflavitalea soli]AXY73320.1 TetR/AcrR family transcriptional regulator [Paraflavitalea soli]